MLTAIQRFVRPLAHAAGIRIMDKARLKDWFDHLAKRMMHHAIAKGRRANQPLFGIMDIKAVVCARLIAFLQQVSLQLRQFRFLVKFKGRHCRRAALPFTRGAVGQVKNFKVTKLRIKLAIGFDKQLFLRLRVGDRAGRRVSNRHYDGDRRNEKIRVNPRLSASK